MLCKERRTDPYLTLFGKWLQVVLGGHCLVETFGIPFHPILEDLDHNGVGCRFLVPMRTLFEIIDSSRGDSFLRSDEDHNEFRHHDSCSRYAHNN